MIRELSEDEVLISFKNTIIEYHKRLKAEQILVLFLEKHGYTNKINTHEKLRSRCKDLVEQAKEQHLTIPVDYYIPEVNIDINDVKRALMALSAQEYNQLKVLSTNSKLFDTKKNELDKIFVAVNKDIDENLKFDEEEKGEKLITK